MSDNFNWNTQEDDWEGDHQNSVEPRSRKRRFLPIVAGLMVVIAVGSLLYVQTKKNLDEVEGAYTADVISSYNLMKRSIDEGDSELFKTMLSGSNFEWATAQQELFKLGLLTDLRPLGLSARPVGSDIVGVDLNPELNSAEVTIEQLYSFGSSNNQKPIVTLHRDNVFRQGERWLWSPPKEEYWGGAYDDEALGTYVTVFFPRRDAAFSERLQKDLDSLVDEWCQLNGEELCADLRIHIKLSRDPGSLLDLAGQFYQTGYAGKKFFFNGRAFTLSLPTPSLIGLPQDEASYQAFYRGYGSHLIGALTAEKIGDSCCANDSTYHAMVRQQLTDLALAPIEGDQEWEIGPPAIAPEYDLQLICQDRLAQSTQLVNYSWLRNEWRTDIGNRHIIDIRRSPAGDGVFLLEREDDSPLSTVKIIFLREGKEHILFEQLLPEEIADVVSWRLPEREKRLVLEIPDLTSGASAFYNYDLSNCGYEDCPAEVHNFLGTPIWSPNGENLLVRQYGMLWWQQGFLATPLADGMAPFWVDDDSFGFIRKVGNIEVVVVKDLGDGNYRGILETTDLASALEPENRPNQLSIGHIAVDLADSNIWFILAFGLTDEGGAGEAFVFKLNRQTEDISLIVRSEKLHSFSLSPGGGKLSATLYNPSTLSWNIIAHDAQANTTDAYSLQGGYAQQIPPMIDWSPDGQWLLAMNQGFLVLLDLNYHEQMILSPPEAGCTRAVWLTD